MCKNTCCFIGHRKISETPELKDRLYRIIEELITDNAVSTFLFGSKSQFNSLCHTIVTELKEKYSHIKRVYVRAEYPVISSQYKNYLLEDFEETFFPKGMENAGKAVYVERNFEMIRNSNFCIFYYNQQSVPSNRRSGTKIALDFAISKEKNIVSLTDN